MLDKPAHAWEYESKSLDLVRSACLTVATRFGDMMDEIVVAGGLVPSLIVSQAGPGGAHVGTMDLDVGLDMAIFDEGRYRGLIERLRSAGFEPDKTPGGRTTRPRWRVAGLTGGITVDFLMSPMGATDTGGGLQDISGDLAAVVTPGLALAFRDREKVTLEGMTINGERARRDVWVCGPGAFVILKALAFRGRGENKDAYDLYYIVRYFGTGVGDVAARLRPLMADSEAQQAVRFLREDFTDYDGLGPRRVAEFLSGGPDDEVQADVAGFITDLLRRLE